MNRKITILLISILAMTITANAEVLNLTQKDTTTWVSGGATATLTYQPTGEYFNYTLDFVQVAEIPIDYSLVYYKDVACNPTNLPGTITVIGNGTSTFSGDYSIDALPEPDDANANTSCNYSYPYGAKIWLVNSADINGFNLTWAHWTSYLYEENIRYDNGTEIPGTSHLITYTKTTPTPSPTPTHTVSSYSSGSSGQGGMGVNSNERFSNIDVSDRKSLNWKAGYQTKYEFKHNVYEVIVNAVSNEDEVMVKYEGLKDRSASVSSNPPGTNPQYFNLYSGSKRFNSAILRFKSKESPVLLYRWANGNWEAQSVFEIGREGTTVLYESKVSGFSNFAISVLDIPEQTIEATPQITISVPKPTETTPMPTTAIVTPTVPGFSVMLFVIAGIVALGIFKMRRN